MVLADALSKPVFARQGPAEVWSDMRTSSPDAGQLAHRLAAVDHLDRDELPELMAQVDALFAAHHDRVYATCLRYLGDPEQAMELAQDALLTAYQKLPTFRGDARFSTWLFQIARLKCLNAIRKRDELLSDDGLLEVEDAATSPLARMRRRERQELVIEAARAVLDPVEQEAVHLRYGEQLPLDRITALLDIDLASGARGLLQRCKRKLRREILRRLAEMDHGTSFLRGTR